MIIEKRRVIEALRSRGQDARANWVERQLPDEIDTVLHAGVLVTLRLDPADLVTPS